MANRKKMPHAAHLTPMEYKRLRERLYYRRVYKQKKMALVKAWQEANKEKHEAYQKGYYAKRKAKLASINDATS